MVSPPDSASPLPGQGLRVPFGERHGSLFRPEEVENGKACGCVCPGCGTMLLAKNRGAKMRPHFAHIDPTHATVGCYETAVHRFAKQILLTHTEVLLPAWSRLAQRSDIEGRLHEIPHRVPPRTWRYTEATAEVRLGAIQPDVVLRDAGNPKAPVLLVEVLVTHAVDGMKAAYARDHGLAMIEIDLSHLSRDDLDSGRFETAVLHDAGNRAWIHSPKLSADLAAIERRLEDNVEARNHALARKQAEAKAATDRKAARKEAMRQKKRAPFEPALAALEVAAQAAAITDRIEAQWTRDNSLIASLKAKLFADTAMPRVLEETGPDDWIVEAHPLLWRLHLSSAALAESQTGS